MTAPNPNLSRARRWPLALALLAALTVAPAPGAAQQTGRRGDVQRLQSRIEQLMGELNALRGGRPDPRAAVNFDDSNLTLPTSWMNALHWRSIGPGTMGGRIVRIQALESDPDTFWAATASGGLFKTVDGGESFEAQFQHENTVSIGDVAVSQSDPDIVWVGTGEHNPRNSSSYGDGVYKSTDGGRTWEHKGLERTFTIGRMAIHHTNPDIVYVGAMGRTWGRNPERGLYKTVDGGDTWEKILDTGSDDTGVIELQMHPEEPDTLLIATWGRQRGLRDSNDPLYRHTAASALYKTTDGGASFKKITEGLPTVNLGRLGLDYYRSNPDVVFAVVDSELIGSGTLAPLPGEEAEPSTEARAAAAGATIATGANLERAIELLTGFASRSGDEFSREQLMRALQSMDQNEVARMIQRVEEAGGIGQIQAGSRQVIENLGAARPFEAAPVRAIAYVGIQGEDAGPGARLTNVVAGGPAESARLRVGDVIVRFGEAAIGSWSDLQTAIRSLKPGDVVAVASRRGDEENETAIELGTNPQQVGIFAGGQQEARAAQRARAQGRGGRRGRGGRGGGPSAYLGGQRENVQDRQGSEGFQTGGIYKSTDGGESWSRINSLNPRPMYFSQIRVDPSDQNKIFICGVSMHYSSDGGATFGTVRAGHSDHHAVWIDPNDGEHVIVGNDGGLTQRTAQSGGRFEPIKMMAIGQYYDVDVDNRRRYYVAGGLQDNGTYYGPAITRDPLYGPINSDFFSINGGDGFVVEFDDDNFQRVHAESQNGSMSTIFIQPVEGQGTGGRGRAQRNRLRAPAAPDGSRVRFNWKTPFTLSPHNPRIFYAAGSYVLKSSNRGQDLRVISPQITFTEGASGSAIAASPRNPDLLYAGTTDGAIWVTRDGGNAWTRIDGNIGLEEPRWVSAIEASRFEEGRVYVSLDGHRHDDDTAYFYTSEDYGETWTDIRNNIPAFGSARVIREDTQNGNLLFAGTEFGAWVSIDRGADWTKFNSNLPTVAVHDFAISDAAGEIVAATHGRSLWAMNVAALRQITPEVVAGGNQLLQPHPAVLWEEPSGEEMAKRREAAETQFAGENPPEGVEFHYVLDADARQVAISVTTLAGNPVARMRAPDGAGLHRLGWNLKPRNSEQTVEPGQYLVTLYINSNVEAASRILTVEADPGDEG